MVIGLFNFFFNEKHQGGSYEVVHYLCIMDGFFRILKKAVSKLICTRLYMHICKIFIIDTLKIKKYIVKMQVHKYKNATSEMLSFHCVSDSEVKKSSRAKNWVKMTCLFLSGYVKMSWIWAEIKVEFCQNFIVKNKIIKVKKRRFFEVNQRENNKGAKYKEKNAKKKIVKE